MAQSGRTIGDILRADCCARVEAVARATVWGQYLRVGKPPLGQFQLNQGVFTLMICITGAGGTVGSEVLKQLQSKDVQIRAAYNSKEKAERAIASGIDAVVIDYNEPDTMEKAFSGCDRLFLLGPNDVNQTRLESNAVEAAKASGVRYILKQSVMGAADESYSLANAHRPVEKAIEASGLAWSFLRPNSFMQNVVTFMSPTITTEGTFYSASENALISHVDVRDIAAVAVCALTTRNHEGRAYTLTGPEALTYDQVAEELSTALGRTISYVSLSPSDLKGAMVGGGMPEELADRLLDLERYFREGHASGVSNDVKFVTGKNPGNFRNYIKEIAATGILDEKNGAS